MSTSKFDHFDQHESDQHVISNQIHRDIKPSNVLLTDEELTAKICDFNVSEFVAESQNQNVIGTPSYIAPEVWKNSSYSCSCDVFALGCVLYKLMTFKTAFYKDDVDELKESTHPA